MLAGFLPLGHIPQAEQILFVHNWIYHLFPKLDLLPLVSIPMHSRQEPRDSPRAFLSSYRTKEFYLLNCSQLVASSLSFLPFALSVLAFIICPLNPLHQPLSIPAADSSCPPQIHSVHHHQRTNANVLMLHPQTELGEEWT